MLRLTPPNAHIAVDTTCDHGPVVTNSPPLVLVLPAANDHTRIRTCIRIAGITVKNTTFLTIPAPEADPTAVLWSVLDLCVEAEQRFTHARLGNNRINNTNSINIPAAVAVIEVSFLGGEPANTSVLGPLTTRYPTLTQSLQGLKITDNQYDESTTALGAFAALATHLRELTFWFSGLTSVQGLEGRCEYLRKVDISCCEHLTSLEGLAYRACLQEVDVSGTAITSIEPLRTCPNLTAVDLYGCEQLSSIDALIDHQWLQVVDVTCSAITSIAALGTCPALTKVSIGGCEQLPYLPVLKSLGNCKTFELFL